MDAPGELIPDPRPHQQWMPEGGIEGWNQPEFVEKLQAKEEEKLQAEREAQQKAYEEQQRLKEEEKERKRLEKEARMAEKKAEKERLKAEADAEKARVKAEKDAEKARLKAEKDAEKAKLKAEKDAAKAEADAAKAEERERLKAEKDAEKAKLKAEKDAAKALQFTAQEKEGMSQEQLGQMAQAEDMAAALFGGMASLQVQQNPSPAPAPEPEKAPEPKAEADAAKALQFTAQEKEGMSQEQLGQMAQAEDMAAALFGGMASLQVQQDPSPAPAPEPEPAPKPAPEPEKAVEPAPEPEKAAEEDEGEEGEEDEEDEEGPVDGVDSAEEEEEINLGEEGVPEAEDAPIFMEGLLKKRGDVTKSWRERWVVLCFDDSLGYVLKYCECEEKADGSVGAKQDSEPKALVVKGANLKAKFKKNAKHSIGAETQKICTFFQEGPGGRTGDKIHVFKFETLEEKKEWDALLKKASEKVIKWSGEAGALRKAKNLMTQASDMVMGTFSKTFQKKVKSEKKGAQKDFTKSIKETMKSMNPFANK